MASRAAVALPAVSPPTVNHLVHISDQISPPIVNFPSLQPSIIWKANAGAVHPVGRLQKSPKNGLSILTVGSSGLRTPPEWLNPDPFREISLVWWSTSYFRGD